MARPVERLLIADPDRLQMQLLDMLLASGTYELTMVDTGREALEHLKDHTPDLAILALDLPDVEGDVICGKIRRVTRLARVPVVLVSPQSGRLGLSDAVRSRARRAGADLVLPRPLGDKNLAERVRALLDARDATPTREGHTTRILDDALTELTPERAHDESDVLASDRAANDPTENTTSTAEPRAVPPEPDQDTPYGYGHVGAELATDAYSEDVSPGADPLGPAPSTSDDGFAAVQRELATLRLENAQLRRKLAAKNEELQAGPNAELQERIAELERRNRMLNEELEKRGGKGGGGWFGRRT